MITTNLVVYQILRSQGKLITHYGLRDNVFQIEKTHVQFPGFFLASLYWLFSRFLDFSCLREWTKIKLSGTENAYRNRFPFTLCICLDVPLLKAVNTILFHVIDYYRRQEINHTIYFCTGWESNFDLSLWKQSCF